MKSGQNKYVTLQEFKQIDLFILIRDTMDAGYFVEYRTLSQNQGLRPNLFTLLLFLLLLLFNDVSCDFWAFFTNL